MAKIKKANKAISAQRVLEVIELMNNGQTSTRIVQICSPKWHMTRRGIQKYIAAAFKILEKEFEQRRSSLTCEAALRFDYLYQMAIDQTDIQAANTSQMNKAKICGLLKEVYMMPGQLDKGSETTEELLARANGE